MSSNPYDQIPYRCQPIEWTAPERLAINSLLHGGPAPTLARYRVLELGCGDGANLLPLAYYRPQAEWVGVDGSARHIEQARSRLAQLQLDNLEFLQLDFRQANAQLMGKFDFIIVHGVFSWVADGVRDALFQLCSDRLSSKGILYLNYNTKPGWNIRGMVRDYLLAHTQSQSTLADKLTAARAAAAKMARSLADETHPFSQLLGNEFQFVCDNHDSYIAHEFLTEHNTAYWRSEFLALAQRFDLYPVSDADYNYPSGRVNPALLKQIESQDLIGANLEDTVDLISYRQLHTPILSKKRSRIPHPDPDLLEQLSVASCLHPAGPHKPNWYQHPNGYQVEAKDKQIAGALDHLFSLWPQSAPLDTVLSTHHRYLDDLILLHHNGLIELRLPGSPKPASDPGLNRLNRLEIQWGGYYTTAFHQRVEKTHSARAMESA
ncbi:MULTISPECIES: class I SAM-dependent methyltransferase [unclassified Ketobacter]|uniref:class I SAM-dependent methyltransferase n=1 Tax=unclassified Ketobacter TaxID=2639109 RepID=UPI000F14E742|nr:MULTISPECIES: class I SAM-dependent methyltransferase [unclassified Ketobacter]RLT87586.1 MAG: methyltransferase domain-containing protein [Ketobacter sp. GenoA1]RLT92915.1 MAG: methyltransferase domain-containing protein [Ketobacter sp.]